EARIGQKNKITRRWAKRGTRPSAPRDQRTASTYIFGAVCPKEGKGAALIMPACASRSLRRRVHQGARRKGSSHSNAPVETTDTMAPSKTRNTRASEALVCGSAVAASTRPFSAGHVKKPDLLCMRPVEYMDRLGGGLQ